MDINKLDKIQPPKNFNEGITTLYKTTAKKKRKITYLRPLAAACLVLFFAGFSLPGYTRDMPVYSEIFTLFGMEKYQDASEAVLVTKEDQGITITLSNVILSGNVLSYTYIVESERDLGEALMADAHISTASQMKNKITGWGGSADGKKVSENTYLGVGEYWLSFDDERIPEDLDLTLSFRTLTSYTYEGDQPVATEIKGKWNFPLSIKKLPDNVVKPPFIYEEGGIFAKIDTIRTDQAVSNMEVKLWNHVDLFSGIYAIEDIRLTDQEGQSYFLESGGGSGNQEAMTYYYQTKILDPDKSYTLEIDLLKSGELGYNEDGQLEMIPGVDGPEFQNAPDKITAVIPFDL